MMKTTTAVSTTIEITQSRTNNITSATGSLEQNNDYDDYGCGITTAPKTSIFHTAALVYDVVYIPTKSM